jgi:septum formation protein
MKNLSNKQLIVYLTKIKTEILLAYGVYQIEAGGLELFDTVNGDIDSIMGLPIKQVIDYIKLAS